MSSEKISIIGWVVEVPESSAGKTAIVAYETRSGIGITTLEGKNLREGEMVWLERRPDSSFSLHAVLSRFSKGAQLTGQTIHPAIGGVKAVVKRPDGTGFMAVYALCEKDLLRRAGQNGRSIAIEVIRPDKFKVVGVAPKPRDRSNQVPVAHRR